MLDGTWMIPRMPNLIEYNESIFDFVLVSANTMLNNFFLLLLILIGAAPPSAASVPRLGKFDSLSFVPFANVEQGLYE